MKDSIAIIAVSPQMSPPETTIPTDRLRISRDLVPIDLRLHSHLSRLASSCPCACSVGAVGGSRELALAEMTAEGLEEELARARQQQRQHGIMGLDCTNGGTTSTLR